MAKKIATIPEEKELRDKFNSWETKKKAAAFDLEKLLQEKKKLGDETVREEEKIKAIESELVQKKEKLERDLSKLYRRMALAGASGDAKVARSDRTRKLCNLGGLVEKAGLGDMDPATLLGFLLSQKTYATSNPSILDSWKNTGEAALKEQKA